MDSWEARWTEANEGRGKRIKARGRIESREEIEKRGLPLGDRMPY